MLVVAAAFPVLPGMGGGGACAVVRKGVKGSMRQWSGAGLMGEERRLACGGRAFGGL